MNGTDMKDKTVTLSNGMTLAQRRVAATEFTDAAIELYDPATGAVIGDVQFSGGLKYANVYRGEDDDFVMMSATRGHRTVEAALAEIPALLEKLAENN